MNNRLFPLGWGNVTKLAMAYFFATLYFQINSLWGVLGGMNRLTPECYSRGI
jgi:hypothetical protein